MNNVLKDIAQQILDDVEGEWDIEHDEATGKTAVAFNGKARGYVENILRGLCDDIETDVRNAFP